MDQASFVAALIDKVSGPARKMKGQLAGLSKAFSDVNKNAKRDEAGRFVARSGGMLNKLQGTFRGAGKLLGGAVETGVGKLKDGMVLGGVAVAGAAAGIGAATVKMADFAQTSRMGFAAVAKDGETAEGLFMQARNAAELFGLDVMKTSDSFRSFKQQGADTKMAGQLIAMGADMQALGARAEQVESVMFNVNKILAQGKAQGDELGPILEVMNAGKFWDSLGQSIGKTKDELMKMKDAGQLTSDMILPALIQASTPVGMEAGDFAAKAADSSIGGIARVLKAKAQNAFINIGDGAAHGIMSALRPMAGELGDMFKSESFQRGIIGAVDTVSQLVRDGIPLVKEFVLSLGQGFKDAMPAMQGAIDWLFDGFGAGGIEGWTSDARSFGKSLGQVAAAAVTLGTVMGGMLVGGIQLVTGMAQGAIFIWDGMIGTIGAALFAVDDFFSNIGAKWRAFDFGALANSLIDGLVSGISNGAQWVLEAVTNLGSSVIRKFKDVLDINSPSKEFAWLGQMSGLGFMQGLEGSLASNDNGRLLPAFTGGVGSDSGRTLPSMTGSVGSLMGASGGGGGGDVTVNVRIENHFSGGDSEAHARAIKHSFMTELGGALEEIAAGSAA